MTDAEVLRRAAEILEARGRSKQGFIGGVLFDAFLIVMRDTADRIEKDHPPRLHRMPQSTVDADAEIISWRCADCDEWVSEIEASRWAGCPGPTKDRP